MKKNPRHIGIVNIAATGIYYGVIGINELNAEWFDDIFYNSQPVALVDYIQELEEHKKFIFEKLESILRLSLAVDTLDNSELSTVKNAVEEFISAMQDAHSDSANYDNCTTKLYEDEDYSMFIFETTVMVLKAPVMKYVSPCSPCYPNAGDLTAGDSGNAMGGPRWTYSVPAEAYENPKDAEQLVKVELEQLESLK